MSNYVWYLSYGSNINKDRFLCYIKGGKPEGSKVCEKGCKDTTLPKEDKFIKIPHKLYFAKHSSRWNGGVCFIEDSKGKDYTIGKMYLITKEQFKDVYRQENSDNNIDINLDEVIKKGTKTLKNSWYGKIIYTKKEKGYPIFTFTAPWDIKEVSFNKPSKEYLKTIIKGLKDNNMNSESLVNYLINKPGVNNYYNKINLSELIRD
ncbi:MAG: hypothetical protein FH753_11970 [Firmicutes bacterium]|nr:hypothetical protein [Bacillota bacterium]